MKKKILSTALLIGLGFSATTNAAIPVSFDSMINSYINSAMNTYQSQWNSVYSGVKGGNVSTSILATTQVLVTRITEIEIALVRRLDKSDLKISG